MITICKTQAAADSIPAPKHLWYDWPRGIVVMTGADIPQPDPVEAAMTADRKALDGLLAKLDAGTATAMEVQKALAKVIRRIA